MQVVCVESLAESRPLRCVVLFSKASRGAREPLMLFLMNRDVAFLLYMLNKCIWEKSGSRAMFTLFIAD